MLEYMKLTLIVPIMLYLATCVAETTQNQYNNNLHLYTDQDTDQLIKMLNESEQEIEKNVKQLAKLENEMNELLDCEDVDKATESGYDISDWTAENESINKLQRLAKEQNIKLVEQLYSIIKCESLLKYLPSQCTTHAGILTNKQLIRVGDLEPQLVACTHVDNEPYMIIQRRFDGSGKFNRSWKEYQDGFGDINSEFFIGLNMLHQLTTRQKHKLLILLTDQNNWKLYASYNNFVVGSESEGYVLKDVGIFQGNIQDALSYNKGMMFSTYDSDNDKHPKNCAAVYNGWWHNQCSYCTLNGNYTKNLFWISNRFQHVAKDVLMLIRPEI